MKFLLDTHVLLWVSAGEVHRVSDETQKLLASLDHEFLFSVASLWEIAIKRGLGRADFRIEPRLLHRSLLDSGYREVPITSEHAFLVEVLPALHRDPFDRILVVQAMVEGAVLLTVDDMVLRYPGPIRKA